MRHPLLPRPHRADLGVLDAAQRHRWRRRAITRPRLVGETPDPLDRRPIAAYRRAGDPLEPAYAERQRESAEQIDDVVLAEVDEREAEHAGVGAADGAGERAALGEQQRGHRGSGEVQ